MRQSIMTSSKLLPESAADYVDLRLANKVDYTCCCECALPFSTANVKTSLGWAETQISGLCEVCYDNLFKEGE